MIGRVRRYFASVVVVCLVAACGSSEMTDRLEATYAIADFEIEGAERSRTAFRETIVDGPQGISQAFTPVDGVSAEDVHAAVVAAAEADGWELIDPPGSNHSFGYRPVAGRETCDAVTIFDPLDGLVIVKLQETRCI